MARLSGQLERFGIVGISATLVHVAVVLLLVELARLNPSVANALAFCAAVSVSYLGNHRFTFVRSGNHVAYFRRYALTAGGLFITNNSVFFVLNELLGINYLITLVFVVAFVAVLGFCVMRFWVFA